MYYLWFVWAILRAYSGKTIPGRIYLVSFGLKDWKLLTAAEMGKLDKGKKPYISYSDGGSKVLMSLSLWPLIGWYVLFAIPAMFILFFNSPKMWLPGLKMEKWYPDRRYGLPEQILISAGLASRYAWASIALAGLVYYVEGANAGIVTIPATGLSIALGYFLSSFIGRGGDLHGKLLSGALFGLSIALILEYI